MTGSQIAVELKLWQLISRVSLKCKPIITNFQEHKYNIWTWQDKILFKFYLQLILSIELQVKISFPITVFSAVLLPFSQ